MMFHRLQVVTLDWLACAGLAGSRFRAWGLVCGLLGPQGQVQCGQAPLSLGTYTAAQSAAGARCSNRKGGRGGEGNSTSNDVRKHGTTPASAACKCPQLYAHTHTTPTPHTRDAHRGHSPAHLHKLDAITDMHCNAGVVKAHCHVGEELFRHLRHHAARMEGAFEVSRGYGR